VGGLMNVFIVWPEQIGTKKITKAREGGVSNGP